MQFYIMKHTPGQVRKGSFAVVFSSTQSGNDDGYAEMAERMVALAEKQHGFLGVESARNSDGHGITVSYWESEGAISRWKQNLEHQEAQRRGQSQWYASYSLHVCRVERTYGSD